jgi:alpha-L-fucosidase 2
VASKSSSATCESKRLSPDRLTLNGAPLVLPTLCLLIASAMPAQSQQASTAWSQGAFHVDRKSIVERSDIILQRPNKKPTEAMPLGNGRLGISVWAQDGYTAQLNRGDTFPLRLSTGQVVIPGLRKLTNAADYSARLNLYNGEFEQHGGGMTAITYVTEKLDVLAIDVTGADPKVAQTAELKLWAPRHPQATADGKIATIAETWLDDKEAGASGKTFGSLAAITADASEVNSEKAGDLSVKLTFFPHKDGSFRVLIAAPTWHGGDATVTASTLLTAAQVLSPNEHREWWNTFWERPGLMKLSSPDHAAEYFENLRIIDLFTAAAESRDHLPGSQAGIGDLFSSIRDEHKWGPSAYWHWNLRMQVSANLGAGVFALNDSYFNLYRDNLEQVIDWTKRHMAGRSGTCVPETMRFNGQGYENETWIPAAAINCGEDSKPYYNARTISTGAEVSMWIWRQYLMTGDRQFLAQNYPVMRESTRFLLAYATHDSSGMLHTQPSNAHEMQWDVHDPTTDVSAMHVLFPAVIEAATLLNTDPVLVAELKSQIPLLPQLPLVSLASLHLLIPGETADAVIPESHDPGAATHNSENVGLEPVWPYGIIGDDGPMHALGVRTFMNRPNKNDDDWSADPEQAARLGLADEVKSSLRALTEKYQAFPSGLATFMGPEFYIEQDAVLADALQKALADDYDGLLRVAPAWPADWDADGTVYIQHGGKVDVQIRKGKVLTVGVEAGSTDKIRIRNPWPGQSTTIIDAHTSAVVTPASPGAIIELSPQAGGNYLLKPAAAADLPFETISGAPSSTPKALGSRTIGIFAAGHP